MSRETSAGVLAYRPGADGLQFLLVHPGGPFWARKDEAAWSIPKGLAEDGEDLWAAAQREVAEELGQPLATRGPPQPLTPCRTPGGKLVVAWLVEAEFDLAALRSNTFELEWPRGSGRVGVYPEVDRADWFRPQAALSKIHKGQRPILEEAIAWLNGQD